MAQSTGRTPQNWRALRRLALEVLRRHRDDQPNWCVEDALRNLQLPPTPLFRDLARQAGYRSSAEPTPEEVCAVAAFVLKGVWSPSAIARETGIALNRILAVLKVTESAYGIAPYGSSGYGGTRKLSDGIVAVERRVTAVGQFSYKGRTYCLGAAYRGRQVKVLERGSKLVVSVSGRETVTLSTRP